MTLTDAEFRSIYGINAPRLTDEEAIEALRQASEDLIITPEEARSRLAWPLRCNDSDIDETAQ